MKDNSRKRHTTEDYSMLECIPHLVTGMQNEELTEVPELDEVKRAVFLMNRDNACGSNGFSGVFYQQ